MRNRYLLVRKQTKLLEYRISVYMSERGLSREDALARISAESKRRGQVESGKAKKKNRDALRKELKKQRVTSLERIGKKSTPVSGGAPGLVQQRRARGSVK